MRAMIPAMSARASALIHRNGVRQLVKFCLVGASSTLIDKATLWILLNDVLPFAPWWVCATLSFCFAVTNSFVWNRRWTFRARGLASIRAQYWRFVFTNVIGLLLNLGATKLLLIAVTGELLHRGANPQATDVFVASICSVPLVMLWNFTASKYWTFRVPRVRGLVGPPRGRTDQGRARSDGGVAPTGLRRRPRSRDREARGRRSPHV